MVFGRRHGVVVIIFGRQDGVSLSSCDSGTAGWTVHKKYERRPSAAIMSSVQQDSSSGTWSKLLSRIFHTQLKYVRLVLAKGSEFQTFPYFPQIGFSGHIWPIRMPKYVIRKGTAHKDAVMQICSTAMKAGGLLRIVR